MKLSKHVRDIISVAIIGLGLSGSYLIAKQKEKPLLFITKQQSSLNLDNSFLQYLNFGQKRLYSSLFWIATILESDHDHYKGRDLNSWMFLRFLTITNLEPNFLINYNFGGPYLSILKDDLGGASVIYKKGLKVYPDDYWLLRNASFHFYFEAKDYQYAKKIIEKLAKHEKVPLYFISSLARMNKDEGNPEEALVLFNEYQKIHPQDTMIGAKIYEYRYSLTAEIDLDCLNESRNKQCSIKDLDGNHYILQNGKFVASKNWTSLRKKERKTP